MTAGSKPSYHAPMVYASVWTKKDIRSWNKVSIMQLLVVSPTGDLVLEDSKEKTAGRYVGRQSKLKMKEIVRDHTLLELEGINLQAEIPLANVSLRPKQEIDEILVRIKSGTYEGLKEFR